MGATRSVEMCSERACFLHDAPRDRRPFATARRSSELYRTARWKRERLAHLAANPCCVDCRAPANTVDHEPPHRGDPAAFFDRRRYVSRCRTCHNVKTGRETRERANA